MLRAHYPWLCLTIEDTWQVLRGRLRYNDRSAVSVEQEAVIRFGDPTAMR
jgi:hypothetical protein